MRRLCDDQFGISWLLMIVVAFLGVFGFSFIAAINWKVILALFAAGIIGVAMFGVVFMKQDFKIAMMASIVALAIVFVVEVSFPVIVGGIVILFVIWKYELFSQKPIIFSMMVGIGLLMMLIGYKLVLVPLGVLP